MHKFVGTKKSFYLKAFSLVEISIVILVVAILTAGISQGIDLYSDYRFTLAQNLTRNSIVNRIDDLVAWYETTLPSSFKAEELAIENSKISVWYDNNSLSNFKNNATAQTPLNTANQPILVKKLFDNAISGMRFDGAQTLWFDGRSLANTNYTIFVVEQRRSNKVSNYFIVGNVNSTNTNLHIGYRYDATMTIAHYNNDSNYTIPAYSSPIATIHKFSFNTTIGKSYSANGKIINGTIFLGPQLYLQPLSSFNNAQIAKSSYIGDIAEIIIFKKDLTNSQTKAVEDYLGKKFGIIVN